jgi:hypothetical protein
MFFGDLFDSVMSKLTKGSSGEKGPTSCGEGYGLSMSGGQAVAAETPCAAAEKSIKSL